MKRIIILILMLTSYGAYAQYGGEIRAKGYATDDSLKTIMRKDRALRTYDTTTMAQIVLLRDTTSWKKSIKISEMPAITATVSGTVTVDSNTQRITHKISQLPTVSIDSSTTRNTVKVLNTVTTSLDSSTQRSTIKISSMPSVTVDSSTASRTTVKIITNVPIDSATTRNTVKVLNTVATSLDSSTQRNTIKVSQLPAITGTVTATVDSSSQRITQKVSELPIVKLNTDSTGGKDKFIAGYNGVQALHNNLLNTTASSTVTDMMADGNTYRSVEVYFSVTGATTSGAVIFEQSSDTSHWEQVYLSIENLTEASYDTQHFLSENESTTAYGNVHARYFRVRLIDTVSTGCIVRCFARLKPTVFSLNKHTYDQASFITTIMMNTGSIVSEMANGQFLRGDDGYKAEVDVTHRLRVADTLTGTSTQAMNSKIPSGLTVTSTRLLVDGSGVTQPVSVASIPSHAVTNAGTFAVQVDSSTQRNTVKVLNTVPVSGTFYQATQPVSLASVPSHAVTLDSSTQRSSVKVIQLPSLPSGSNSIGILGANSGVDIGDVTINNASGASAVNIQDGGNTITVDGTVGVSGTVTVGSHAVTNAGTFAVQVDSSTQRSTIKISSMPSVTVDSTTASRITHKISESVLPTGAATESTLSTLNGKIPSSLTVTSTRLLVDPSGVTSPVSLASVPSHAVTNAGTFAVQVDSSTQRNTVKVLNTVPVSGTFWQATQPVSIATAPVLVAGSAIIGKVGIDQTTPNTTNAISIAQIAGTTIVNGGLAGSLSVGGTVAHNGTITANPLNMGAQAVSSENAAATTAKQVQLVADLVGKLITLPYANPENFVMGTTSSITNTTSTAVIASAGGSLRNYVTSILVTNGHATVGTYVKILDGTTIIYQGYAAAAGGGFSVTLPVPLRGTAATAINAQCVTTGSDIIVSCAGYKGL